MTTWDSHPVLESIRDLTGLLEATDTINMQAAATRRGLIRLAHDLKLWTGDQLAEQAGISRARLYQIIGRDQ